jgi:hypothetical protein
MYVLLMVAVFIGLAYIIANIFGNSRQIGFGWSFFFSFFFSPLIGFIITILSRKCYMPNPKPSKIKSVIGWILIILNSIGAIGLNIRREDGSYDGNAINTAFFIIGFVGFGYYLIEISKGKNFNERAITENIEDK